MKYTDGEATRRTAGLQRASRAATVRTTTQASSNSIAHPFRSVTIFYKIVVLRQRTPIKSSIYTRSGDRLRPSICFHLSLLLLLPVPFHVQHLQFVPLAVQHARDPSSSPPVHAQRHMHRGAHPPALLQREPFPDWHRNRRQLRQGNEAPVSLDLGYLDCIRSFTWFRSSSPIVSATISSLEGAFTYDRSSSS